MNRSLLTDHTLPEAAPARGAGTCLQAVGLDVGYGDAPVIEGLDLTIGPGRVTTVIGPNGCGKSTLLRALGRLLPARAGAVLLDGARLDRLPTRHVATRLALLPQTPVAPAGLLVRDLVARGRHPHRSWLHQWSADDEAVVAEMLHWTGLDDLADTPVERLSGGQRQRAWIAMALAQQTELVLLDEPTTYLDLSHQIEVLDLIRSLNLERGRTVVMVLHDLNLAARYSDELVAIRAGRVVAAGPPDQVLTPDLLREVFGLDAQVLADPVAGTPLVVPVSAAGRGPSGSR